MKESQILRVCQGKAVFSFSALGLCKCHMDESRIQRVTQEPYTHLQLFHGTQVQKLKAGIGLVCYTLNL